MKHQIDGKESHGSAAKSKEKELTQNHDLCWSCLLRKNPSQFKTVIDQCLVNIEDNIKSFSLDVLILKNAVNIESYSKDPKQGLKGCLETLYRSFSILCRNFTELRQTQITVTGKPIKPIVIDIEKLGEIEKNIISDKSKNLFTSIWSYISIQAPQQVQQKDKAEVLEHCSKLDKIIKDLTFNHQRLKKNHSAGPETMKKMEQNLIEASQLITKLVTMKIHLVAASMGENTPLLPVVAKKSINQG